MRRQPDSPTDLHRQLAARFRGPLMPFFLLLLIEDIRCATPIEINGIAIIISELPGKLLFYLLW